MLATAFITVAFVIQSELKRRGFVPELASSIVMAAAIGGIVGAKIYSALLDGQITFQELFSTSGLVWYGGFIGGFLAVVIVVLRSPNPFLPTIDSIGSSRHPRIRHRSNRVLPRWRRRLWTAIRSTVGDGVPEWHCPNRCACPSDPLYTRRSCHAHFSVFSGRNAVGLRRRPVLCSARVLCYWE